MESISAAAFASLHNAGESLDLIDVRTPAEYRQTHVAFARNIPLDQLDAESLIRERGGVNCARPLYVVCHSGTRSRQAVEQLRKAGLLTVIDVEGGTVACVAAGLPAVHGKKTISLDRQMRIVAGALAFSGTLLSFWHSGFLVVPAFVGAGLMFAGITDICPMLMVLARMPWNRADRPASPSSPPACSVRP